MTSAESLSSSLSLRPASVAPSVAPQSGLAIENAPNGSESAHHARGGRRGGRGRGRGRGTERTQMRDGTRGGYNHATDTTREAPTQQPETQTASLSGRGLRTRDHGHTSRAGREAGRPHAVRDRHRDQRTSQLNAEAAEFQPGQYQPLPQQHPKAPRPTNRGGGEKIPPATKQNRGRGASISKSTASDIATRTHEDIANGVYECPICTSEVLSNSKVWSCKICWTVFHLSCIEKWSTNEGSTMTSQQHEDGSERPPRQWRCPGCNLPKDTMPSYYTCWCEKEMDPRSTAGLPPHSCGQTCGKSRVLPRNCPHPCDLICHAGPCPPCSHMGPLQSCYCGKNITSRRCVDTNYDSGWSCAEICGDTMPCGEHLCPRPCHEGLCGACEVTLQARCYCGKEHRDISCCERSDARPSAQVQDNGSVDNWTGTFGCAATCQRSFDCGKHSCEKSCHPQDAQAPPCPHSPAIVKRCPCGKSMLADLMLEPRRSCEDPIPNCDKACSKRLNCGHRCQQVCHAGDCKPCLLSSEISCRCGRTQCVTICHQGFEEPPQCTRSCKATLNCSRHECGERCCSGERKASERQATKRKLRPLGASHVVDDSIEAEHICTRVCGRQLKCGNHACPELCHKGPCGSCREAIFDEICCHCGKTVLQPPLPCGTRPPTCTFQCERPKACGHPLVPHNCHGDNESCPKCPFLESKPCLCNRHTLKNQPCWLNDVRCGDTCGKKLRCGSHFCRKQCHRPGECEDVSNSCQQVCGKPKKACGHPCEEPCHAPSSCREDKHCQNKMLVTCECQHLRQEVKCGASRTNEGNTKRMLSCDDECARLARNRRLAGALNIDPETHQNDHVPYSNETLRSFRENVQWALVQEKEFRIFAADEDAKRLRFKPMPSQQRAFIHSLSKDFGMESESMDPEPYRHVAVFKTPRFVMAPMKTLSECVRIRANAEMAATKVSAPGPGPSSLKTTNEPYNGFLLSNLRFGITIEEVRAALATELHSTPALSYDVSFLPSEEIVLKASPSPPSSILTPGTIEASLRSLKHLLATATSSSKIASTLQLCALDSSLNILRREMDESVTNGGWSQVAAKAAAPRSKPRETPTWGGRSAYTVLGSKVKEVREKEKKTKLRKKEEESPVVDDWEEAIRKEEEEVEQEAAAAAAAAAAEQEEKAVVDRSDDATSPSPPPFGDAPANTMNTSNADTIPAE